MRPQKEIKYLIIPEWERIPFLIHGFGTRELTLEAVSNLDEFKDFKTVLLQQIHSSVIHIIEDETKKIHKGDALITSRSNILLVIRTADCLPVFIMDESRRVAAAAHCGWRGTAKKILPKALKKLDRRFGCRPDDLSIAFGPCIGQDCYEVGRDVVEKFHREGSSRKAFKDIPQTKDKFLLDLKEANRQQLFDAGVRRENMFDPFSCSHCDDRFLSHRRKPEQTGRLLNFIGWRE